MGSILACPTLKTLKVSKRIGARTRWLDSAARLVCAVLRWGSARRVRVQEHGRRAYCSLLYCQRNKERDKWCWSRKTYDVFRPEVDNGGLLRGEARSGQATERAKCCWSRLRSALKKKVGALEPRVCVVNQAESEIMQCQAEQNALSRVRNVRWPTLAGGPLYRVEHHCMWRASYYDCNCR